MHITPHDIQARISRISTPRELSYNVFLTQDLVKFGYDPVKRIGSISYEQNSNKWKIKAKRNPKEIFFKGEKTDITKQTGEQKLLKAFCELYNETMTGQANAA